MPYDFNAIPWLHSGATFPPTQQAWPAHSPAPGLLAAGADLEPQTLQKAYAQGIYPWFNPGEPILWWSPNPRMVLPVDQFRLHRSLRKTLVHFQKDARRTIRFDSAFLDVIHACAHTPRNAAPGTWISPAMVQAYMRLHQEGKAHSVETWVDDRLVGGLYCVSLGHAVFGESMFSRISDASKIALAALVAFCRAHAVPMIDCQQNTKHLASLGGVAIDREDFQRHIRTNQDKPALTWHFDAGYWDCLLKRSAGEAGSFETLTVPNGQDRSAEPLPFLRTVA